VPVTAPHRIQWTEPTPIDASNAQHSGCAVLLQGPSGSGKTHFVASMPHPIVVGVTESNISVYVGRIAEGAAITLFPLRSWADYQWFVRKTKNREWDASTVALDSYTVAGGFCVDSAMARPGSLTKDGMLQQTQWNRVKSEQFDELLDLLGSTQPAPGKPTYNVAVTVHEQDEEIRSPDGQQVLGVSAVSPAVPGGLRRHFAAKFDCVFITASETTKAKDAQGLLRPSGVRHFMWAVPPDHLRSTKDGLGGNGGRKALPPQVENTWRALQAAWTNNTEEK
jgi:hypothetical protein